MMWILCGNNESSSYFCCLMVYCKKNLRVNSLCIKSFVVDSFMRESLRVCVAYIREGLVPQTYLPLTLRCLHHSLVLPLSLTGWLLESPWGLTEDPVKWVGSKTLVWYWLRFLKTETFVPMVYKLCQSERGEGIRALRASSIPYRTLIGFPPWSQIFSNRNFLQRRWLGL